MGDYGFAVSQKGYDVKTCVDRKLVVSSAFQKLKVFKAQQVTGTIPASGTSTITFTHNIGFYAPYVVIYNGDTTRGTGTSCFFAVPLDETPPPDIASIKTRQYTNSLQIDVEDYFGNVGDTIYFTVYVFLDDFSTLNQQNINTSTTTGATSTDYGLRVSKEGHDVKTCADVDLVMSSSYGSQIVHKKGIATSDVSHNLGYIPNYLSYGRNSGDNYIEFIAQTMSQDIYTSIDNTTLYDPPSPQDVDYMYYIIFKNKI
jgi:hypothetical protein